MIKTKTVLEFVTQGRIYTFICDPESPLGELHDVLLHMKNLVVEKIIEHNNSEKNIKEEESTSEH